MQHRLLTCRNHSDLRWQCKEIAWGANGYNGVRHIFFNGRKTVDGFDNAMECNCPPSDLILAPEDNYIPE